MAANTDSKKYLSRTGLNVADRLDPDLVADSVLPTLRPHLRRVVVLDEIDSTNSELARIPESEQHAHALLAECQTVGRGRRERRWHSPAGGNIYLSLGWRFALNGQPLACLPLVAAISVANALRRAGLQGHGIKWPNDILVQGRKLAGILVEMQSAGQGHASAIFGIGLNVRMPASAEQDPQQLIDRPWTDLESHLPADRVPCDRNQLAARLLEQLMASFERFSHSGFDSFRAAWTGYDLLHGNPARLVLDDTEINGTASGINEGGELLMRLESGEVRAFHSGEVRVFND